MSYLIDSQQHDFSLTALFTNTRISKLTIAFFAAVDHLNGPLIGNKTLL